MALTQMQIIQSLGEAMGWFERELNWGVPATELRHLCGRIGELYAALITNGQMATEVNQKGYDVVSSNGERISVKTTAMSGTSGHISFNARTIGDLDRVIILRINTEEMQIETLLDASVSEAIGLMAAERDGKRDLALSKLIRPAIRPIEVGTVKEVSFEGYTVRELETGTIQVELAGRPILPVKPALRRLAMHLNIALINTNGNALNTRSLGSLVIRSITQLNAT
ncbi:DUF6998 domain-containing protein [Aureliella helgolandensis]|uniref:DUF6998 domain-containing protein n=1 Tax=Aureliella helgolandensis TaxID=2527968 RepID=A0A518GBA0_9BACT|nr:hypothetical protein [Aureliella helgolandensis]QDV25901.1 hypothetical protein Q31a_42290 [Aureliella helgolandensis]